MKPGCLGYAALCLIAACVPPPPASYLSQPTWHHHHHDSYDDSDDDCCACDDDYDVECTIDHATSHVPTYVPSYMPSYLPSTGYVPIRSSYGSVRSAAPWWFCETEARERIGLRDGTWVGSTTKTSGGGPTRDDAYDEAYRSCQRTLTLSAESALSDGRWRDGGTCVLLGCSRVQ